MKKKTIFALAMAFVMGALAVTPLFAQDFPGSDVDTEILVDTTNLVKKVITEDQRAKITPADLVDHRMIPAQIALGIIAFARKEPLDVRPLVLAAVGAMAMTGVPADVQYAAIFVAGYENTENKDAYLANVFSHLTYKGDEEYQGDFQELVNAIREQNVQAFREEYDNYTEENRLLAIKVVFSVFDLKKDKAEIDAE